MFNLLVSYNPTAWETDQLMRMEAARFKEHSDPTEAAKFFVSRPRTLKRLEPVPTLLMYEKGSDSKSRNKVLYGYLHDIKLSGSDLTFRFTQEGTFPRKILNEFADRLGIDGWEHNRTHWAIKDGDIPTAMLAKLQRSYDVVLSFAGEDRKYVEAVAKHLHANGVRVFYDTFEQAVLWGKDLAEHLESIYGRDGQYCVIFVSKSYAKKMWTRHERRAALARALQEQKEYILPARFDNTQLPGILPTTAHISISDKTPARFSKLLLEKLGKAPSAPRGRNKTG